MEKVNKISMVINDERLNQLQALFPEAFTEGKVDFEKLRQALGEHIDSRPERYSFTWAGKHEAMQAAQIPSRATLIPDIEQSIDFDETQNIFIEGDNLEVLKLLARPYFGQVKIIYIDPPYNTGNDFVYPDNYADPLDTYLRMTGQKNGNGDLLTTNSDTNGRYHSAWLSMMYPRLFIARQLLRQDGVIFVSIDDKEVHNLRMIMNEIFGEGNFIANLVWQKKYGPANDAKQISQTHEHILVYAKVGDIWSPELLPRSEKQLEAYKNPDNDPRGIWRASDLSARTASDSTYYPITIPSGKVVYPPESRSWIVSEERFQELVADNRIWFGVDDTARPMIKKFLTEVKQGITPQTWWDRDFAGDNKMARYRMKELFPENPFDTPKPVELMKRILQISTTANDYDIVLDFFAGSGSMGEAVLNLNKEDSGNRRFILIQLPEPTGRDDFNTIADICRTRLQRVAQELNESSDEESVVGFRTFKLTNSNFKPDPDPNITEPDEYIRQMELFAETLLRDDWKTLEVVYEIALKEGFGLNLGITTLKVGSNTVYRVQDNEKEQELYICLDEVLDKNIAINLNLEKDTLFICHDRSLDDTLAVNLALQTRLTTV